MDRFLKIGITILILTIVSFGQQKATVAGQLENASNQQIQLVSQTQVFTTQTDTNGNYKFQNIADGEYLLIVGEKKSQVRVKDGDAIISKLGEVFVIASGNSQSIDQVSKSVSVIDAPEMRNRADFSLAETLRTIPGLRVQQLGGFGRLASIKTRGLRNQDTAILIDGIRFRDPAAITGDASPFLSDITLTSVNRIEVLRGSGSSLYGTNAVGGTIDFQTPIPKKDLHGQVSGAFGGLGLKRFRGNISDANDKIGFNVGVSRTIYSKGIDGEDDAHNTNAQGRIEFRPFQNTNISARFFLGDSFVRLNSSPDTIGTLPATGIVEARPLSISELNRYANGTSIGSLNVGNATFIPDANDPDATQKGRFLSSQIALTQVLNSQTIFKVSFQDLRTKRTNKNGVRGVGFQSANGSIFDGSIQTLNAKVDWTANRFNNLTFGYEFENEKFGNDNFNATNVLSNGVDADQRSNTLFVQEQVSAFESRLQISGAFRAQFFSFGTPKFLGANPIYQNLTLGNPPKSFTADGSAAYFIRESGTKIRAHVGNGYRIPSLYERFGTFFSSFSSPVSFVALGDPSLKPEKTVAVDGGIDQSFAQDRVKLSATYFYTKLIDTIGFANVAPSIGTTTRPFGGYANTKGGIARGAEFSAEIKPFVTTSVFASYTYTNSDQRTPQVSGSRIIQTLGIPNKQFSLVVNQQIAKRFNVNFDFLATSSYLAPIFSNQTFATRIYRFGGNRKGDLTASYAIPTNSDKLNWKIFGTVENIFNQDYFENGFRTAKANGRIGLALQF